MVPEVEKVVRSAILGPGTISKVISSRLSSPSCPLQKFKIPATTPLCQYLSPAFPNRLDETAPPWLAPAIKSGDVCRWTCEGELTGPALVPRFIQ